MIEPVSRPPLWETVLVQLRAAILNGELRAGERLVEADLARRFGTSRGPIREAVHELVGEGLIVDLPRRGSVVATLTARDLAEVYGVREALEMAAAPLVVDRADDAAFAELDSHLDAFERADGDYLANSVHDLAFHRDFVAFAGNARMTAINERMLTQTAHLLRAAADGSPTLQTTIRPSAHRAIAEALRARDVDAAREAVAAHYRYAEERLFPGLS